MSAVPGIKAGGPNWYSPHFLESWARHGGGVVVLVSSQELPSTQGIPSGPQGGSWRFLVGLDFLVISVLRHNQKCCFSNSNFCAFGIRNFVCNRKKGMFQRNEGLCTRQPIQYINFVLSFYWLSSFVGRKGTTKKTLMTSSTNSDTPLPAPSNPQKFPQKGLKDFFVPQKRVLVK